MFDFFQFVPRRSRRQLWRDQLQEELAIASQKNLEFIRQLKECKLLLVSTDESLDDEQQRAAVMEVSQRLEELFNGGIDQQNLLNQCRRCVEKLGGD